MRTGNLENPVILKKLKHISADPLLNPMQRALALARQALGTTSPNPAVGAVVVKEGTVIGEGFTLPPGQRHAEIGALAQAGFAAQGAELYTTLEPCCHFGRTPPCTEAIIAAGVKTVHLAVIDPNPRVAGGGCAQLQSAGIQVVVEDTEGGSGAVRGVCEAHSERDSLPHRQIRHEPGRQNSHPYRRFQMGNRSGVTSGGSSYAAGMRCRSGGNQHGAGR